MVSKLSDVLVKAVNEPLGYAVNWDGFGHYGQYTSRLHAAALNLVLLRVPDTMLKDLA
jgi:hypothetical protein